MNPLNKIYILLLLVFAFSNCDKLEVNLKDVYDVLIYGKITLPDGTPVPGLEVTVNDDSRFRDITDEQGIYQISYAKGESNNLRVAVNYWDGEVSKNKNYEDKLIKLSDSKSNRELNITIRRNILNPVLVYDRDGLTLIKYNFNDLHLTELDEVISLCAVFRYEINHNARISIIPGDVIWGSSDNGGLTASGLRTNADVIYQTTNSNRLNITSIALQSVLNNSNGIALYYAAGHVPGTNDSFFPYWFLQDDILKFAFSVKYKLE